MSLTVGIRSQRLRRKQRGLTLIEAAMVLAVATLVLAGVMLAFQTASTSGKIGDSITQLGSIQQAVRSTYSGRSDYANLDAGVLIDSKALQAKMVNESSRTIRHPFNGNVEVAPATNGFTVTYDAMPPEACVKLVTLDLGTGVQQIAVGGTTRTKALTPAEATSACGSAPVDIVWTFY